jgi:hypothetical protein
VSAPAGWYPDPGNPHVTRYWDGNGYTHERHWNGSAWVEPPPVAPPAPPTPVAPTPVVSTPVVSTPVASATEVEPAAATPVEPAPAATPAATTAAAPAAAFEPAPAPAFATPPVAVPSLTGAPGAATAPAGQPKPPVTFWVLVGGCVGVALAALLPWVSVSGFGVTGDSGPRNGGPLLLWLLAAGIVAIAWPLLKNAPLSMARRVGLLPIVGFLAIAVFTNWSDLSDLKDQTSGTIFGVTVHTGITVDPGAGLLLYTVSVIVLVGVVVRIWTLSRRAVTA